MVVPLRIAFSAAILYGAVAPALAQMRYQDEVFPSAHILSNVKYGQAVSQQLDLDVYTGAGDTARSRPLVVFIHGGGFRMGTKATPFAVMVCTSLARRGYVAASIDYRLSPTPTNDTALFEAMLLALHDAKAAVRFFRRNAATYGLDPSQIFSAGSSAGAVTALHLAYLDSSEVPGYVDWSRVDGSFEGSSGNPGYSSAVQGVISNWGAIGDTAWIRMGDVPVYCVHGTSDSLVFYTHVPAYGPFQYSSKYIFMTAQQKGIPSGLRLFYGAGHELDGDTTKQDSAIADFSAWLFTILRASTESVQEAPPVRPTSITLDQNFPNPFNPETVISGQWTADSFVRLAVYDVLGREVAVLANGRYPAGRYSFTFDGSRLASGVYFYRLTAGTYSAVRTMLLVR